MAAQTVQVSQDQIAYSIEISLDPPTIRMRLTTFHGLVGHELEEAAAADLRCVLDPEGSGHINIQRPLPLCQQCVFTVK